MTLDTKIFAKVFASLFALSVMAGCSEADDLAPAPVSGPGLTLKAESVEMLPLFEDPKMGSRGTDPKREDEKQINILHVFFFSDEADANGKHPLLMPNLGTNNFRPYQRITSNVLAIPDLAFTETQTQSKAARIYAVANIPGSFNATWAEGENGAERGGTIVDGADFMAEVGANAVLTEDEIKAGKAKLTPCTITCLEDLEEWIYMPELRDDVSRLPADGMPMAGSARVENIAQQGGNVIIPMKALMARVDIAVKLQPNQQSLDGRLPSMTITEYGVKNMPVMVPFTSHMKTDSDRLPDSETSPYPVVDRTVKVQSPYAIDKESAPETFTYYTYENVQNRDPEAQFSRKNDNGDYEKVSAYDGSGNINYPQGIDSDAEKQRWKPAIARTDRASALVLSASYITHQGLRYDAKFTVYLGKDALSDFRVVRNCQYNNNITISGLDYVRNSTDGVYTFDGRVNIKTENPIYLAIVNERKVDAHASVRPMDVWFLLREPENVPGEQLDALGQKKVDHKSTVTISVRNPETTNWIRMEKVTRTAMRENHFKAGTGARDYFTTDLVTNTLKDNHTITIDGDTEGSRSRVYFYIDENVTPDAAGNINDRVATIDIVYENSLGDRRVRELEIEQRGLLRVQGSRNGTIDTYMEYYEEYLEHFDPLDDHIQPGELYEGLAWGLDGVKTSDGYSNSTNIYSLTNGNSFGMTQWVINRNGAVSMNTVKLFNESSPATAFHYCYGKNKRTNNGLVPSITTGWYMPGISELEVALVQYYSTFNDFQGNLYWSCSAGKHNVGIIFSRYEEYTAHARTTGVTIDTNGNATFVMSGNDEDPGSRPRTEPNRIRAFYKIQ